MKVGETWICFKLDSNSEQEDYKHNIGDKVKITKIKNRKSPLHGCSVYISIKALREVHEETWNREFFILYFKKLW